MATPDPRSIEFKAALAAAVGALSVGFVPMFMTGLYGGGVDTVSALLLRYATALAVLVPLAAWTLRGTGGLVGEWRRGGRWLALNGVTLGALQVWLYFSAVETLPTSVVITIFYCYPVIAIALDRLMHAIPIRSTTIVAAAIVVGGVSMTSLPGFAGGGLDPTGLMFACLAPLGYSVYLAVAYPITKRVQPLASATFIYGAMGTTFAIVCAFRGEVALPSDPGLWLNVLFIGTAGGALQIVAFAYALPRLSSSGYSLILCLEVVTVVLSGVVILGERLGPWQWLGIVLVLGGILLERLARARRASRLRLAELAAARRPADPAAGA